MSLSAGKKAALTRLKRSEAYQAMTPGQKAMATKRIKYDLSEVANKAHATRRENRVAALKASSRYKRLSPGQKAAATRRLRYATS